LSEVDGKTLAEFVHGDVSLLERLESVSQQVLLRSRAELPQLEIGREDVAKVVAGLRSGKVSQVQAQRWASLVRRGFFPRSSKRPITPVEIEIDEKHETIIVDCIARLDELGDWFEGEIQDCELDGMMMSLRAQ
jgi:hypothetical protein